MVPTSWPATRTDASIRNWSISTSVTGAASNIEGGTADSLLTSALPPTQMASSDVCWQCGASRNCFPIPNARILSPLIRRKKDEENDQLAGVLLRAFFRLLTLRRKRRDDKVLDRQQWRKMGGIFRAFAPKCSISALSNRGMNCERREAIRCTCNLDFRQKEIINPSSLRLRSSLELSRSLRSSAVHVLHPAPSASA